MKCLLTRWLQSLISFLIFSLPRSNDGVSTAEEEEEEEEIMDEDGADNIPILSLSDAKRYMFELRRFFESRDHTTDKDFMNINQLEQSLTNSGCNKQSVISDYFT